jgi:S1-C subfamily serine protease
VQDDSGFGYYPQSQYPYPGQPGWPGGPGGPGYYGPPPQPPRRGGFLTHLLVAVLAAALAVGLTMALYHPGSQPAANASPRLPGGSAVPNPGGSPATGPAGSEQQVVNKVEPGLVIIQTTMQYQSTEGFATGMVINSDGLVLTNNHVIEDSTKITAKLVSTGKSYPARLIGYDPTGDVALIQLEGAAGLRTVPIGNSSLVKVGASVVALGNAEGQGTIIPAGGEITGLDKTITASDEGATIATETLHGMLETNAGIVSGDSGGPLVSTAGQVIGMDTAGSSNTSFAPGGSQSTAGFAIPIDTALSVARQIAAGHASSTVSIGYPAFIGILIGSGSATSPQQQAQQQEEAEGGFFGGFGGGTPSCYKSNSEVGVPSSIAPASTGTLVDGVICSSPADSAGLTAGSVIASVDGRATSSPAQLQSVMATLHPGDTVAVSWVSPSGQSTTSHITLAAGPPQ